MDYELTKKLKEAGFKFNDPIGVPVIETTALPPAGSFVLGEDYPRIPTLEELIEACGEEMWNLQRTNAFDGIKKSTNWQAWNGLEGRASITRSGKNPNEAVANLWLELNKK